MATDTGYLNYILSNPDLRENAEAAGLTQAEMIVMGETHWNSHGINEGRQNSPTAVTNTEGYTQELGARHYSPDIYGDKSVEDILQASVRAGDPSEMWDAREALDEKWNLDQYSATDWNMAQDNPYYTGILGNTIDVDTGVGQIYDTGDNLFVQDRYNTGSQANDFLDDWVTDDKWTGPAWGANYWDVLTTAERDVDGNLRATIPRESTGWDTSGGNNSGLDASGNRVESGAVGATDLLAYRPWTKNYWNEYIPKESQGLLYMNKPQRDYGLAYLPGEHRDPVAWGKWADDHKGHIPGGGWRFTPESYKIQQGSMAGKPAPWHFTSGAPSATNIYNNPWNATSMNLTPTQGTGWQGFLSGLGNTPAIDTTTKTLLGV